MSQHKCWLGVTATSVSRLVELSLVILFAVTGVVTLVDPPAYLHASWLWAAAALAASLFTAKVLLVPGPKCIELAASLTVAVSFTRGIALTWALMFEPLTFGSAQRSFWIGAASWGATGLLSLYYWLTMPIRWANGE